jgi:GT2 family glycosyltransferase
MPPLPAATGGADLAVVLVHYHTPRLAAAAIAALQRDLAHSGGTLADGRAVEWLVVDNGSDAAGRELLAGLPVRLIEPGSNLGYAGGVNLGVARSRAEHILLMNPDVEVLPGCVARLMECLRSGAAAAGPRFFWDSGRRLLLPPAEERGRGSELLARLAAVRGGRWAAAARRRSRRHCHAHWLARAPLPSHALSGSLLAVRRAAWQRVGGFDEGYRLYFEETDWLLRLRRAGLPCRFVPAAEAVHLYGRSAAAEPRAPVWFEESARRFRRRHYGAWFDGLLGRVGGTSARAERAAASLPPLPAGGLDLAACRTSPGSAPADRSRRPPSSAPSPRPLWVEVSPNVAGFPAAAERLDAGSATSPWRLPAEVAARLGGGPWWVAVSDEEGRDLARFRVAHPGAPGPAPDADDADNADDAAGAPGAPRPGE